MKLDLLLTLAIVLFSPQVFADDLDSGNGTRWSAPALVGGKSWSDAFAKASALVANMTLEEKVNMTTGDNGRCVGNLAGVPRLGIERFCLEDGPVGVRPIHGVSQFPAGLAAAATWDEDLIYKRSLHMGQEFYDQGVHIALAPVTGGPLGRAPRWYADPYATGVASYLSVKGLQDSGVAATAKHFIGYEQETFRNPYNPLTSNVPFPPTLMIRLHTRSTCGPLLKAFELELRIYNEINQTQACHNAYTQNHLLKRELAFQGSIISDWGGQHDNVAAAHGGMDMSMPGHGFLGLLGVMWGDALVDLVRNGTIPEERVTDMVTRILTPWAWLGQDEKKLPDVVFNTNGPLFPNATDVYRDVRKKETADVIRKIGAHGATLLKNSGVLPLQNPQRIAVLGNDAVDNVLGVNACGGTAADCPSDNLNGTMSMGGGSGYAYAPYIVTPLDALKKRAIDTGAEISAITLNTGIDNVTAQQSPFQLPTPAQAFLPATDVTLVFLHAWASESYDRPSIELDDHMNELVETAVKYSSNVVVVMHIPGVANIERWVDNENVTAVVAAWYPGQESGNGLVDVLYGDINPSGKLPFTWAKSYDDYAPGTIVEDPAQAPQANFSEGIFVDYRWFDAHDITPRYEFGFGLSYTTFNYSDIVIDESAAHADKVAIQETAEPFLESDGSNSLYDVLFTVSAAVTNTGNVTGSEVAQLYLSIPEGDQPPKVLRGFDKVKNLAAGESATATFELRRKDLSVWDVVNQQWHIPEGKFVIHVGASSRNLPLSATWSKSP
ncbi:hypothetical protein D9758_003855 [Tetrapyrgos nigripes]|uniref:Probable beta-glucosidase G n=1 Tax=Tetrapyrgos nigripes TaxID=182062 RepID=A0A8H5LRQ6_9AGAR|nr:hypothetical protein D9758_003855 [Tetrapyrgos nigripes]